MAISSLASWSRWKLSENSSVVVWNNSVIVCSFASRNSPAFRGYPTLLGSKNRFFKDHRVVMLGRRGWKLRNNPTAVPCTKRHRRYRLWWNMIKEQSNAIILRVPRVSATHSTKCSKRKAPPWKIYGADWQATAEHVDDLHWKVKATGWLVKTYAKVSRCQHSWIIGCLQPRHVDLYSWPLSGTDQLFVMLFQWTLTCKQQYSSNLRFGSLDCTWISWFVLS